MRAVRSGKTPYVRFDRNLYSIPHSHVRKPLTLLASATRIRILDGQNELANHHRTYNTGLTVEDPVHLEGLLAATRQANVHTTRDRLRAAVPATVTLFERLAERGEALRPHATRLLALLDDYGPEELAKAVHIALERDALGAGSITHILETRRRQRGLKPRSDSPCPTDPDCGTSTSAPMTWRPTMPSDDTTTATTLQTDLRRLGFSHTADQLNDLVASATRKRWSPTVLLERIVADELEESTAAASRAGSSAPTRSLQAARRLGLGLALRTGPTRPRAHPHPRLPSTAATMSSSSVRTASERRCATTTGPHSWSATR